MKSEAEIEQEARILSEIVREHGWKALAKMVLIDSEAKQRENKKPKEKQKSPNAGSVELPENLRTVLFVSAWRDWLKDRADRKKPVTPMAANIQLKKLSKIGSDRAVLAIENSIEKGYQGIFEPKSGNSGKAYEPPVEF